MSEFESVALLECYIANYKEEGKEEGVDHLLRASFLRAIENIPLNMRVTMTTEKNITLIKDSSNVVAGTKSIIKNNQIAQGSTQNISDQQFEALTSELDTLKKELVKKVAEDSSDDAVIQDLATVSQAQVAANSKDADGFIEKIKSFGPKAIDIAVRLALPTLGYYIKEFVVSHAHLLQR